MVRAPIGALRVSFAPGTFAPFCGNKCLGWLPNVTLVFAVELLGMG